MIVLDAMWFQPQPAYKKVVAVVKIVVADELLYFMGASDRMEFNVVRLEDHDLEECERIVKYGFIVPQYIGKQLFGD